MQICKLADLIENSARSFEFERQGHVVEGFVIHWRGEFRAWLNACPHTGVNLDWAEDQFFSLDQDYIQCSLHGALFKPLEGTCVYGPCVEQSLTPVAITVQDGWIVLPEQD